MLMISKEECQYMVELFQVNRLNTLFSDLVKAQLRELIEEPGAEVLFNLEGIRFIDSSGFEVLMEITELAREHGSQLKLCNVTEEVRELIILQELEGRFTYGNCQNKEKKIQLMLD
jgi:anti-anti-sigma factor